MDDRRENREGSGLGGVAGARRLGAAVVAVVLIVALAACEPSAPPGFSATPAPPTGPAGSASAAPQGSVPVAGSPTLTVDGATVRIVGLGNGVSPDFDLPAGSAVMTVSVCASNQVIPFVTLFDGAGTKLAIIVEPQYEIKNLVGGKYRVEVAANPACVWTIEVTPA
jgi:hypothetical protein